MDPTEKRQISRKSLLIVEDHVTFRASIKKWIEERSRDLSMFEGGSAEDESRANCGFE